MSSLIIPVPAVVQVQCHYCSRFWPRSEVLEFGESIVMCFYCHQKHVAAVDAFKPPRHCQGPCGRTFDAIAAATPGDKVQMTVHWRDDEYQILCAMCDADYVPKRRDIFGATRFGYERGVK